jgi:general secretion pathway protein G
VVNSVPQSGAFSVNPSEELPERVAGSPLARYFLSCRRSSNRPVTERGFTMIEMIIVITIVFILASVAVPIYKNHLIHAREDTLKDDLYSLRTSIEQYTRDKNKAPQSLDDLVNAGYLRTVPKDPITDSNQTWEPVSDDSIWQLDQTDSGIVDVHSGSNFVASDGTAYNTW